MEAPNTNWRWQWWLGFVAVLLVAYPLSLGPVYALVMEGYLPEAAFLPYLPLDALDAVLPPPINDLLPWYLGLWHAG